SEIADELQRLNRLPNDLEMTPSPGFLSFHWSPRTGARYPMVRMIPRSTGYSRTSADRMMTLAPRAALLAFSLLLLCFASVAQAQNASPSPTPSPSPTATAAPTAVPLPDIVAGSDSALERLNGIQSELSSSKTVDNTTRELAATTKEIDALELETRRILRPGV